MADIIFNRSFTVTVSDGTNTYIFGQTAGYGVASGTMSLNEVLCDGELRYGTCYANKFEAELFGYDADMSGMTLVLKCNDNGTEKSIFHGIIESAKTDKRGGHRKVVAYDQMYFKRDTNVADWWDDVWENQTTLTLKALRESLLQYVEIEYVNKSLPNDNVAITKTVEFTSISFSSMLQSLCEIAPCIPNIGRDGKMDFVTFGTVATNITSNYETPSGDFQDYVTDEITGINVFDTSGNLIYSYGDSTNSYPLNGNIFLLTLDQDNVDSICTTMYNNIHTIQYKPCKLTAIVPTFDYALGNKITTDKGTHYIMGLDMSGMLLINQNISCIAEGQSMGQQASFYNNDVVTGKKLSSFKQDIDGIKADVYDSETGETKLDIVAGELSAEVSGKVPQTGGEQSFGWSLVSEGFNVKSNGNTVVNINQNGLKVLGNVHATSGVIEEECEVYGTLHANTLSVTPPIPTTTYDNLQLTKLGIYTVVLTGTSYPTSNNPVTLTIVYDGYNHVYTGMSGISGSSLSISFTYYTLNLSSTGQLSATGGSTSSGTTSSVKIQITGLVYFECNYYTFSIVSNSGNATLYSDLQGRENITWSDWLDTDLNTTGSTGIVVDDDGYVKLYESDYLIDDSGRKILGTDVMKQSLQYRLDGITTDDFTVTNFPTDGQSTSYIFDKTKSMTEWTYDSRFNTSNWQLVLISTTSQKYYIKRNDLYMLEKYSNTKYVAIETVGLEKFSNTPGTYRAYTDTEEIINT